ncbi:MAG TPA: hypothetical protein VMK84_16200, partial [Streptosporangiaceae bacterium]|nr:hypothetical protein [Streptosporangiaceae bacterium]
GSGYHRGSRAQPVASCVLAAADAYVAMRNARTWRPALDPGQAGAELRALGGEGKLNRPRSTRCSPRRATPGRGCGARGRPA